MCVFPKSNLKSVLKSLDKIIFFASHFPFLCLTYLYFSSLFFLSYFFFSFFFSSLYSPPFILFFFLFPLFLPFFPPVLKSFPICFESYGTLYNPEKVETKKNTDNMYSPFHNSLPFARGVESFISANHFQYPWTW